jgi:hypothetical protein
LLEIHFHFQAQLKKTIFYKICFFIEIETIKKLDELWIYIYSLRCFYVFYFQVLKMKINLILARKKAQFPKAIFQNIGHERHMVFLFSYFD